MSFYVYLLASRRNGTLYVGQTDCLPRRMREHKTFEFKDCFTAIYKVTQLMYWEEYPTREEAKKREETLKKFSRARKLKMIEKNNPNWMDLAADWNNGEAHYTYQEDLKLLN